MAELYTRDTGIALSLIPESTFNTALTTAVDYNGLTFEPVPLFMPEPELIAIVGNSEFPVGYCPTYWKPFAATLNPAFLFTGFTGRLGLQAHGGTVTATQQAATAAYKHDTTLTTTAAMKGRSIAMKNGNYSFLFAGNAVDSYSISQVGGQVPQVSVGMVGTGKFTKTVPFTMPSPSNVCTPIVTTAINITDSYGTRDLYARNVYSWTMTLNNGADATSDLVRSGADATQGPTGGLAKYPGRILKSFPRGVSLQVTVPVEEIEGVSHGYWEQMAKQNSITSVSLRLRGDLIASTYYYQIDWIMADCRYTAIPIQDNNSILAYQLTFSPVNNATPVTFAVTNITTAAYA